MLSIKKQSRYSEFYIYEVALLAIGFTIAISFVVNASSGHPASAPASPAPVAVNEQKQQEPIVKPGKLMKNEDSPSDAQATPSSTPAPAGGSTPVTSYAPVTKPTVKPTVTPKPSPSLSPTPTPTPTPSPSPSPSPDPTPTPPDPTLDPTVP